MCEKKKTIYKLNAHELPCTCTEAIVFVSGLT